jgi:translation initiation factor 2 beta subunit (eIF-2beta)/eIF-5
VYYIPVVLPSRAKMFCFTLTGFDVLVQDILYGSVDHLINSYIRSNTDGEMHSHANLLLELLMMRDGMLEVSDSHYFTKTDIDCFAHFVNSYVLCTLCTNLITNKIMMQRSYITPENFQGGGRGVGFTV